MERSYILRVFVSIREKSSKVAAGKRKMEKKKRKKKFSYGKGKKIAYAGLLTALAFVCSYVETLLPVSIGIPGAKLGLANLVILTCLYAMGEKPALLLSFVRILLVGFTFGNLASMLYSVAGAFLSYLVMVLAKKSGKFSITGVSVLGGIFHNFGQILVAIWVLETGSLIYYFPVLLLTGTIAGTVIGILGGKMVKRLKVPEGYQ